MADPTPRPEIADLLPTTLADPNVIARLKEQYQDEH